MQIAILAGGLATRLGGLASDKPKSMVQVCGRPFLEHQINMLKAGGATDIVLCIGHLGEQIRSYFGDGSDFGVSIRYSREEKPLGTAGALKNAGSLLNETFFTIYGDSYLFVDLEKVRRFFRSENRLALMTVLKNCNKYNPSNTIVEGAMVRKYSKREPTADMAYVEYGLNIMRKRVLGLVPDGTAYGLEDLFPRLIDMNELLAYEVGKRFYEIGSPESLGEFEDFIKEVSALSAVPETAAN